MSWLSNLLSGNQASSTQAAGTGAANQAQTAYSGMTAPTLNSVTPEEAAQNTTYTAPQTAQMSALSNLAANGGRSAASDAAAAQITGQEGAQAQSQRNSVMQGAAQRGQANGNTALLGELSGNQAATNTEANQGAQLAGNESQTAIGAGEGAAAIGSNLGNASDTMARFNAGENLQGQEYNAQLPQEQFQDQSNIAAGSQKGGADAATYYTNLANQQRAASASQLNGLMGVGGTLASSYGGGALSSLFGGAGGGAVAGAGGGTGALAGGLGSTGSATGDYLGGDMSTSDFLGGVGAAGDGVTAVDGGGMAHGGAVGKDLGGLVPGQETVPGDSPANDTVPIMGSAGEVMVPKSLRQSGSPAQITSFVKHPPVVKSPSDNLSNGMTAGIKSISVAPLGAKDHEAMLSALKRLGKK